MYNPITPTKMLESTPIFQEMKFGSWAFFRSKQNKNPVPISTFIDSNAENPRKDNYKG